MAWSTPVTHSTGDVVTASDWNIGSADLSYLYGDTGWTAVTTFTNSWVAEYSQPPTYRRMGNLVMLVGYIGGGTAAAAAFTLPSGYRPTYNWEFAAPAASSTTFIDVIIGTSGTVTPHVTSGGLSVCTVFPIV